MKQFESDVFEALLEFLHTGSCDLVPSLLPGMLCAAQYYEVEDLHQLCVESMKQTNSVSPLTRFVFIICLLYFLD